MSITTYGLQQIKKELQHLPNEQLAELLLRVARYKKENKELLAYLLFNAHDEQGFIEQVKAEVGFNFSQLPTQSYFAAKGLRKILRLITKYVKFTASKPAEIELLISFCQNYLQYADRKTSYKPLRVIFIRQLEKIRTSIGKLHEDLQYDYSSSYEELLADADKKLQWLNINDHVL
ncbi:hypothetical protein EOD41_09530 [Mucilaginibacter limnophilus]|uniref:Uncharacterized protein n=1 Tax=Mucilaginibacter limnophilus TaxID=1932778 RepID=A0A3S2WY78_9SPHI|nr:hypothetical protein [Mucilaginibacter limnophilus]RVU00867.1 hypothetical protein EOD41_09530 [Mucilaginibacter limnophilus]